MKSEASQALLGVREITGGDIPYLVDYWMKSDPAYLVSMGVDLEKLPTENSLREMLSSQLSQSYESKSSYCIIWLVNNIPSGHSNINRISFGNEAYMHLHLWNPNTRKLGYGEQFLKKTIPYFFNHFKLLHLYSEPYALNPAPHKALERAGFELEMEYITTPGAINFQQPVKRWHLSRERYLNLYQ